VLGDGINDHVSAMCGRIIQSGGPLRYAVVDGLNVRDGRAHDPPPRWNGALLVIRRRSPDRRGVARSAPTGPNPVPVR
jgi:hypothetical protein